MSKKQPSKDEPCDGNCNSCASSQSATCPQKVPLDVRHVVLVISGKGGVGKSTVSVNLAFALASHGYKVGLVDLDMHGPNVPKMLGIEDARLMTMGNRIEPVRVTGNLSVISMAFLLPAKDTPIIWRGPMKMTAIRQFLEEVDWGPLDFLVVDLPPGTGDEALTITQIAPNVRGAVVVTTPQEVALLDSRKAVRFVEKIGLPVLGIIENMSGMTCPHCGQEIDLFGAGGGKKAAEEMKIPFFGSIPMDPAMRKAGDEGRPFLLRTSEQNTTRESVDRVMEALVKSLEG